MSQSYIVGFKIKIRRQEGDSGCVVYNVDPGISLIGKDVLFQVRDDNETLIFEKDSTNGTAEIEVVGQVITVKWLGSELVGHEGFHHWEMQITSTGEITTIGKGIYEIINEIAY